MKIRKMLPTDSTWTEPAPDYYRRMRDYHCASSDDVYSRIEHEQLVHSIPDGNLIDSSYEWVRIRLMTEKHDPSCPMISFLWISRDEGVQDLKLGAYSIVSVSRSCKSGLNGCGFGAAALWKCRDIVFQDALHRGRDSYILNALVNPNDSKAMALFKQRGFKDYDAKCGLERYHRLSTLLWVPQEQRRKDMQAISNIEN